MDARKLVLSQQNGGEELSVPPTPNSLPTDEHCPGRLEDVGENHLHYLIKKKKSSKQIEQRTDAGRDAA